MPEQDTATLQTPAPAAQGNAPVISEEVKNLMNASLGLITPDAGVVQPPEPAPASGEPPPQPSGDAADAFSPFKEKFGYQSPEDAIKEIEELRALKANPPKPEAIKFENDTSKALHEAIQAGDTKKVQQILTQQHELEHLTTVEVSKDTAPDIIKAAMKVKYADLTDDEIKFKFNKDYGYPKEPVKKEEEYDDDFDKRKEEWREKVKEIDMERVIEAKASKGSLLEAKQKLVLPQAPKEDAYEQWKQQQASQPAEPTPEQIMEGYKDLTAEKLSVAIPFKDEANKVDFNFQFTPSEDHMKQALEVVADFPKFFSRFQKSDGSLDREGFVRALVFAMNADSILGEALNQAKNGTIKSKLPDNRPSALVRSLPGNLSTPQTEMEKQMAMSLAVR